MLCLDAVFWRRVLTQAAQLFARSRARVSVYTDGSAERAGGWAYVVVQNDVELHAGSGGAKLATNNSMELAAAIAGLHRVLELGAHRHAAVELVSDSQLVLELARGAVDPERYGEQGQALRRAALTTGATCRWVRGHSGNRWNELADARAGQAREAQLPSKVRRRRARRAQ